MREKSYIITILAGDGIGPEVTAEAVKVLGSVAEVFGFDVNYRRALIGGEALSKTGEPLPSATITSFAGAHAVLLGAVGDPVWDAKVASGALQHSKRPEAGLLQMRKHLGLYANLRPVATSPDLASFSPLKSDVLDGTDLLVVRELTGGIYFGTPATITDESDPEGINTMRYRRSEIDRIARVAFEEARTRRSHVTSVDKANVLSVSQLWRKTVNEIQKSDYPDVHLDHMYVDNAAMQLVSRPTDFDVVLTSNLFGDILSDLSAVLVGSLGLLPSASIGGKIALFEPVHGSAPDIASQNIANPTAAILSAAMLLDYLGENAAASIIRSAVADVYAKGNTTCDVHTENTTMVTTSQFGDLVTENIEAQNVRRQTPLHS